MSDNLRFDHSGTVDENALEQNDPKDNASFTDIANATTFETYGRVQRDLKARHVTFIALGGNLGTGLFLGIGRALRTSGPLSLFLGYAIASSAGFMMMMALGEMAAWLPLPGAIPQFCARYVDDALGFAVGWNTWFTAVITLCAEISAVCSLIQFWSGAEHVSVAVWIVILTVALLALNILAVKVYGEAEFACAVIKLCGIIGLLITALVIDLGGVPTQNRLGFHYWKTDGIMKEYIASGSTGWFLGLFSTLVNASFSLGGVETVVVAAGEAENPRRNIPRAIRRVFWRLLFFFVLASFALGLICPSNNSKLLGDSSSSNAESPWVIAINLAGIKALPSIVNVVVLIAGISSGNSYVFMGSRYLYALACNQQAPKIFLRCTEQGIPIFALLVTMSISFLRFMSMGSSSNIVFQWFQNLTIVSTLYTWISICIAYMRFHAALKAQNIDRSDLPFSFPLQPYSTYFTLGYLCIVVFFNGFDSIAGGFNLLGFITSYIGFPLFFGFFLFWKILKGTKWKRPEEADLFTGKAELDAIEWPRKGVLGSTEVSGGSPATINDLPYVVSISKLGAYTCAGVIISRNRVVTSAQCVYGLEASPTSLSVRAGSSKTSSGGYAITVSKIFRHPQFKPTTNDFDVAVLQLSSSITPGPTVKLAEFVQSGQEPADGAECVASGWGDLEGQLQSVTLPIVNREKCNETYAGQITDRMICAGSEAGKGTCPGDRGGPVTCGGKLAGIISQTNGCDLLGLPDVFTDVANTNIQAWIKSQ